MLWSSHSVFATLMLSTLKSTAATAPNPKAKYWAHRL